MYVPSTHASDKSLKGKESRSHLALVFLSQRFPYSELT